MTCFPLLSVINTTSINSSSPSLSLLLFLSFSFSPFSFSPSRPHSSASLSLCFLSVSFSLSEGAFCAIEAIVFDRVEFVKLDGMTDEDIIKGSTLPHITHPHIHKQHDSIYIFVPFLPHSHSSHPHPHRCRLSSTQTPIHSHFLYRHG